MSDITWKDRRDVSSVSRVHVCNICGEFFNQADAEIQKGYSQGINEHLCMPCIDAVAFLRSKKKAKFVR